MRILIAEDLDDTRHLMKLVLEMKGHAVLEAQNGKEAVECAIKEHPDLILMDLSMPVMDGLAATRCIRANAATAGIPIIALSAHLGDAVWRDQAFRCGCSHCYAKPLDFDALEGLLAIASEPR
jgi:two-component system cell cycle response regulator DivK